MELIVSAFLFMKGCHQVWAAYEDIRPCHANQTTNTSFNIQAGDK